VCDGERNRCTVWDLRFSPRRTSWDVTSCSL
jgi:hypothetical protein